MTYDSGGMVGGVGLIYFGISLFLYNVRGFSICKDLLYGTVSIVYLHARWGIRRVDVKILKEGCKQQARR